VAENRRDRKKKREKDKKDAILMYVYMCVLKNTQAASFFLSLSPAFSVAFVTRRRRRRTK
jgi:hypothetical protein